MIVIIITHAYNAQIVCFSVINVYSLFKNKKCFKSEYHAVETPGGNYCCLMANNVPN